MSIAEAGLDGSAGRQRRLCLTAAAAMPARFHLTGTLAHSYALPLSTKLLAQADKDREYYLGHSVKALTGRCAAAASPSSFEHPCAPLHTRFRCSACRWCRQAGAISLLTRVLQAALVTCLKPLWHV